MGLSGVRKKALGVVPQTPSAFLCMGPLQYPRQDLSAMLLFYHRAWVTASGICVHPRAFLKAISSVVMAGRLNHESDYYD
jgi:hypothetical protein